MKLVMQVDRRKVCVMRLDERQRLRGVIYDDCARPIPDPRQAFWVARLSSGAVVVTRR